MGEKQPQPAALERTAAQQAKDIVRTLLRRWPWLLYTAALFGLSRVCDLAAEPWQSLCELVVKLGKVVTP